jgi:hypothetical protein
LKVGLLCHNCRIAKEKGVGFDLRPSIRRQFRSSGSFLAQTGRFAAPVAQVVKLGAPRVGVTQNLYLFKAWRMEQKSALYPYSVRSNTPHSKTGINATFFHAQNRAPKSLHSFSIALYDAQVNPHGIARFDRGDLGIGLYTLH